MDGFAKILNFKFVLLTSLFLITAIAIDEPSITNNMHVINSTTNIPHENMVDTNLNSINTHELTIVKNDTNNTRRNLEGLVVPLHNYSKDTELHDVQTVSGRDDKFGSENGGANLIVDKVIKDDKRYDTEAGPTSNISSDHSAHTKAHIPLAGVKKWNTSELNDAILSFRIDNSLKSKIQNNNLEDNFTEEAIKIIRDSVCIKNNENLQSFMIMLKKAFNKDLLHHTQNTQLQFEKLLTLLNIFTILNDAAKVGASVGTMIDEIINILETPLFPSMLHPYKEIATEQSTPCLSKCAVKLSKDINLEDDIGLNVVPIS